MFSNAIARLGLGAPAAAAVTFGLFTFMWVVISGYNAPDEAEALPELEAITPQNPVSSALRADGRGFQFHSSAA